MSRGAANSLDNIERALELTADASKHRESIDILIEITNSIYWSEKWNIYDYKDPSIYSRMKFSDSEWQWEFTRRNEIYRRLWLAERIGIAKDFPASLCKMAEDIFQSLWLSNPNIGVLDIREREKSWKATSNDIFLPDFDSQVKFLRDFRPTRVIYEGETTESLKFTNHTQFYFRFDTDLPIGSQILEVKRFFASSGKKKAKRASRAAWPEYLRVWDAAADGLSLPQIALLLRKAQNDQSARDSLRAATAAIRGCATVF